MGNKATKKELRELEILELKITQQALSFSELSRIRYLTQRKHHNSCVNPKCKGYEALKEDEQLCGKCGSILYKAPKQS